MSKGFEEKVQKKICNDENLAVSLRAETADDEGSSKTGFLKFIYILQVSKDR